VSTRRDSRRRFMSGLAAGAAAVAPAAWPASTRAAEAVAQGARAGGPPTSAAPTSGANGLHDITRFGAVGNGKTLCTGAIQRAIDECAARGGGLVLVPPGRFLTGALFLRSNLHLHLSPGAVLVASERFEDFPPIDSRSEGIERKTYASLLTGQNLENVTLSGTGTLDGRGPPWWQAHETTRNLRLARGLTREAPNPAGAPLRWPRPRIVNLIRCQGVSISGLSFSNGPHWNLHLVYCQNVVVEGITMTGLQAQNCDGIIIDSCKEVRVANCSIASGSESIAIKSGYNEDGRRVGIPCEDIVITNCHLSFSVGSAITIGSETAGGIKNVAIDNCNVSRSNVGVHIRSPRGRGGVVERIRIVNLTLDEIESAAVIVSHYFDSVRMMSLFGEGPSPAGNPETDRSMKFPVNEGTPHFRDLDFSGLQVGSARAVALIEGLPERPIEAISFRDVHARSAGAGISCTRASDVSIAGLHINPTLGSAVAAKEVDRLDIQGLRCARGNPRIPLVRMADVRGAFVHGCYVSQAELKLLQLEGGNNQDVTAVGNKVAGGRAGKG
jgi:polygalacturonase